MYCEVLLTAWASVISCSVWRLWRRAVREPSQEPLEPLQELSDASSGGQLSSSRPPSEARKPRASLSAEEASSLLAASGRSLGRAR